MTKTQLAKLAELHAQLLTVEAALQDILDDEQAAFDGKSERWQESDAGVIAADRIAELESAVEQCDGVQKCIEHAHKGLT